jgi:hypothetical protein
VAVGMTPVRSASPEVPRLRPHHGPSTMFEYVGSSGLTATGSVTRRQYVFEKPGARVAVDHRDVPSLRTIPWLRQAPAEDTR